MAWGLEGNTGVARNIGGEMLGRVCSAYDETICCTAPLLCPLVSAHCSSHIGKFVQLLCLDDS